MIRNQLVESTLAEWRKERQELAAKLQELDEAISRLQGKTPTPQEQEPTASADPGIYEGLSIADAAVRFLEENTGKWSSRQIADGLSEAGYKTRSRTPHESVHVALVNAESKRNDFHRIQDGRRIWWKYASPLPDDVGEPTTDS